MKRPLRSGMASVTALLAIAALTACGGQQTASSPASSGGPLTCTVDQDSRISIATGNTIGVYYVLGNAYAQQISNATGGRLKATAADTTASVANIQQLVAGKYQVAFSLFDTAADAVAGRAAFDGKPADVVALGRLYDNATHVIVRKDSQISTIPEMKGKRISTGSPNSGTEVIAKRMLAAAGLNPDRDIVAQRLDLTKTVEGMKSGTLDGFFWSGGLPTSGVTDLFTTAGDKVTFVDPTPQLAALQKINPVYAAGTIPASVYETGTDAKTILVPNVLLVRPDLDPNIACVLTKTLVERKGELVKASPAANGINLDTIRQTAPVPVHPGATKALDDLGAAR